MKNKLYRAFGCIPTSSINFYETDIVKVTDKIIHTKKKRHKKENVGRINHGCITDSWEIIFTDLSEKDRYMEIIKEHILLRLRERVAYLNVKMEEISKLKFEDNIDAQADIDEWEGFGDEE